MDTFWIVFRFLFRFFSRHFRIESKQYSEEISFCRRAALKICRSHSTKSFLKDMFCGFVFFVVCPRLAGVGSGGGESGCPFSLNFSGDFRPGGFHSLFLVRTAPVNQIKSKSSKNRNYLLAVQNSLTLPVSPYSVTKFGPSPPTPCAQLASASQPQVKTL